MIYCPFFPSLVDNVAYVPDIVVTSPKCPPNEDCVVVLQEKPSEAATISGTNSVSIDVEPGNEESNDMIHSLLLFQMGFSFQILE
jgi:hypothetical protein